MADEVTSVDEGGPFLNPWPMLAAGVVSAVAAFLLSEALDFFGGNGLLSGAGLLACLLLTGVGGLAAAGAIVLQPRSTPVLASGAFVALMASLVVDAAGWDSITVLFRALAVLAAVSSLVILLPQAGRRGVVSVLLIFHFGGILSAITNVPPNAPWLSAQAWMYVYRPYLQFMYMNNAYHFYSPNPGPACMLWFYIEYEKQGDQRYTRLVKIPELDDEGRTLRPGGRPLWPRVEYTRRLSLAESINQPGYTPANFLDLQAARIRAGDIKHIPVHPAKPLAAQYNAPPSQVKLWLSSYIRYVARTFKHEQRPELPVTGVKAYRVMHDILGPEQIAAGWDPNDPSLFSPFYLGDYDKDGVIKESCLKVELLPNGQVRELRRDPFLYWLIPIFWEPKDKLHPPQPPEPPNADPQHPNAVLKDYFSIQANERSAEDLP